MNLRSLAGIFAVAFLVESSLATAADKQLQFNRDIRPILSDRCYSCHGPDSANREAGLRLDDRAAAIAELESGSKAIVPGDVAASEMVRRLLAEDADERMPPSDSGKKLSPAEIETLKQWIAEGAEYQPHWAFIAPVKPAPPAVKDAKWVRNEIDNFILARLEAEGLKPTKEASRESLLRRLSFDLTGLPPTLEELDRFLADKSPDAYEKMVEHYLNSPAYAEQMARHWLDLARYADTNGYQYDTERQQWVWRDWVIHAFEKNMPFDQFTIEQLAGDLLPNATPQQRLATGFNRNHGVTIEGGVVDEEYRVEYVMDRLSTTGSTWLGLTIGCARCHDHKFDPLSQKEFYQLYAFFNQVPERGLQGFDPREQIASPYAVEQQQQIAAEIASLQSKLASPSKEAEEQEFIEWTASLAKTAQPGWIVLSPNEMTSSGGSTLTKLSDDSVLVGNANPATDIYTIAAQTDATNLTAVRLETLTHDSLPGGGPGRHSNSNFVLSEFELTAISAKDPQQSKVVKFVHATADYSQANYEIANAIDGEKGGVNGWAVDGPTRKKPANALFVASEPFGYEGGTILKFALVHSANFPTHGIGRPRLSVTSAPAAQVTFDGVSADLIPIAKKPAAERSPAEQKKLRAGYNSEVAAAKQLLTARISALEKQAAAQFPATMIMRDQAKPRPTFLLNRGQYNEPKDPVSANVPAVFPPLPEGVPANRLALARWLVEPQHPLTSRVVVNRYWQRMFGIGIVKTAEDFGLQSEMPSHPELLDWLATEFIRSGWDNKHMLRLMVTSAAYRQSSHAGRDSYARDPENRLLSRGPRLRLDAEEVRDAALVASGLLVNQVGGKSVYPYQPPGLWKELNNRPGFSSEYPEGKGNDLYRRSLYTFWKRSVPSPMLKTFDAPDREVCTVQRSRTNTPLQSLLLLNGPQFVEAARHLGTKMMTADAKDNNERIAFGFRAAIGRKPTADELAVVNEYFALEQAHFRKDTAAAEKLLSVGDSPRDKTLDAADQAAWTSVARLLLNLDEFVSKG